MKLLAKLALLAGATGAAATMYADPSTGASYNEAIARVITIHESVQADFHHVLELQVHTRREKDVIKLNCVNDKLVEMKPQMNVVDRLQIELQSGRDSGDTSALASVVQAGDSVHRLREQADQCVGERVLATESSSEFTHPNIPDDPNTNTWGTSVEPPAYASPFN